MTGKKIDILSTQSANSTATSSTDLVRQLNFVNVFKGYAPADNSAYVRMEMKIPYPVSGDRNAQNEQYDDLYKSGRAVKDILDYAVNGLRDKNSQYTIECPVMSGLGNRPEHNVSVFFYAPDDAKDMKPEDIAVFLENNKSQISERIRSYISSQKQQEL